MTIILEDGTGLSTAETLTSVAEADTYHRNRGAADWALLSTAEKEQALRKANDYLRQAYRARWQGTKVLSTQACDWPRANVVVDGDFVSSTSVPTDVKNAVANLALRADTTTLNPDQTQKVLRERVDTLEVEYSPYAPSETVIKEVEDLLAPYLKGGGSSAVLVRR